MNETMQHGSTDSTSADENPDAEQPIRTLIDERLDFKKPAALRKSFIVASSYRSGSSFLCTSLWESGVLGAPWEYVNTDHELRNLMARFKVSNFADYLPKLIARRTSRNGVFGMKAHFHHFRSALEEYPRLLNDLKPVTFIYINRRDRVAQAVSMAKARQTKSWISLQRALGSNPEYDKEFIDDALQTAERQTQAWLNWFKRKNITPFVVDYEDLVADKEKVVRSVIELMGVQNDEPETIVLPQVTKQGDKTNETWISEFKKQKDSDDVAAAKPRKAAGGEHKTRELMDLAWTAFIYGFPSYELARLRYRALNNPFQGKPSVVNTWRHVKRLRTPETSRVTAANSDMLHSGAWLDLSRGPLIIGLPQRGARYYSVQLMDFFTNNFAVLGRDVTDAGGRQFLVAAPAWRGKTPAGMTLIKAPTNAAWALSRILVDDAGDLPAAYALQEQFTMSAHGKRPHASGAASFDPLSLPVFPIENADPLKFFDVLNAVLAENPPPERDRPIVDRLQKIGVGPSLKFDRSAFSAEELAALKEGIASGRDSLRDRNRGAWQAGRRHRPGNQLVAQMRGPAGAEDEARGPQARGWSRPFREAGNFGTNYLLRARYALVSIGVLPRDEAMYFRTVTDAAGNRLDGEGHYVLHFPPGGVPPVDAFWSLTVYQADANKRRWLVPNEIDRYSIGSRTPGLRHGKDGSLEILLQHGRPAGDTSNWLPVCDGAFSVTLRTYWPRRELLDEVYAIPQIERR